MVIQGLGRKSINLIRTIVFYMFLFLGDNLFANYVWTGDGGDNSWTTAENWNPNGIPGNTDVYEYVEFDYIEGQSSIDINVPSNSGLYNLVDIFFGTSSETQSTSYNLQGDGQLFTDSSFIRCYGSGVNTLGVAIEFQLEGSVVQESSGDFTISGLISCLTGGTVLKKSGSGNLILSAANTYTGSTLVTDGTLTLNCDSVMSGSDIESGAAGTGEITLEDGAVLSFLPVSGTSLTVANPISLSDGISVLNVNDGNDATLTGAITGSGGFSKKGSGTLYLNATCDYSGETVIAEGLVTTQSSNALSENSAFTINSGAELHVRYDDHIGALSGVGTISINDCTLTVNITDGSSEFAGIIIDHSGLSGAIEKAGSGTLILSGVNNYSGGTTVSEGFLILSNDSAAGNSSITVNGGNLGVTSVNVDNQIILQSSFSVNVDSSYEGTFSGSITEDSGSYDLTKTGSGSLILSGTNSYTGNTIVNEGTLIVDGSLNSTAKITVNSGGTIQSGSSSMMSDLELNGGKVVGGGTYASIILDEDSGAVISPSGSSVGTIKVSGNYTQEAGTTYIVGLNRTENDLIEIAGIGTIESGAILKIAPLNLLKKDSSFDILTADGGIIDDSIWEQMNFSSYFMLECIDNKTARLNLNQNIILPYEEVTSGNPTNTKKYLERLSFWENSDLEEVLFSTFFLNVEEVCNALDMINSAVVSSFELINADNNSLISSVLSRQAVRLSCNGNCCLREKDNKRNLWAVPFSSFINVDNYQSLVGFDYAGGGLALGYDHCVGENCFLGVSVGGLGSGLKWKKNRGKADINKLFGGVYGGFFIKNLNIDFSALGGGNFYDVDRNLQFSYISRVAENRHTDHFFSGHLGCNLENYIDLESTCSWSVFCSGDYSYLHQPSYRERGADSLNLKIDKKTSGMMRTELGLKIAKNLKKDLFCLKGYCSLGWVRKFRLGYGEYYEARLVEFIDDNYNLEAETFSCSRNFISPEIGVIYAKKGFDFSFLYKGEFTKFSDNYLVNELSAGLRWSF